MNRDSLTLVTPLSRRAAYVLAVMLSACASQTPAPVSTPGASVPTLPAPAAAASAPPKPIAAATERAPVAPAPAVAALAAGQDAELAELRDMMKGRYSSKAQSQQDKEFLDIRLVMAPIWPERTDGHWLYVEQAAADKQDKPYRQRVYRLTRDGNQFVSAVYALPGNPLDYAGAWKSDKPLASLKPTDLQLRKGCEVYLTRTAGRDFVGASKGQACASDIRGAAHVTADVAITNTVLTTWDRGFNAAGKQVWGSTKGAYAFVKELAAMR